MRLCPLLFLSCVLIAGCGGSTHGTPPPTTTTAATATPSPTAQLEQGIKEAINEDHVLSVAALWTNTVPTSHPATAGPELSALRQSVAQRRAQGVRVKVISEHFQIAGVQLDPSYSSAIATVIDEERVQPSYPDGRPRGKAVTLNEHIRLELHRVNGSQHFVVWKVQAV